LKYVFNDSSVERSVVYEVDIYKAMALQIWFCSERLEVAVAGNQDQMLYCRECPQLVPLALRPLPQG
jgi:hypothetical protein